MHVGILLVCRPHGHTLERDVVASTSFQSIWHIPPPPPLHHPFVQVTTHSRSKFGTLQGQVMQQTEIDLEQYAFVHSPILVNVHTLHILLAASS